MDQSVKALTDLVTRQGQQIEVLTKNWGQVMEHLKRTPASGHPNQSQVFGLPNAIVGERPSSRGFSFIKMLGVLTGAIKREQAKVEMGLHERLDRCYSNDAHRYEYGGKHIPGEKAFMAPLSTAFLQEEAVPLDFRIEMKQLIQAGVHGADYGEMQHYKTKELQGLGYNAKTLSWLNELTGGALVAPPEMGELIELLRNKEALVNAGARTVPLPPQGRMRFPRQTAASLTYWIGENAPIPSSDIGTGDVSLQAKKLAVLIKAPNELLRFASPAAEALMRDDMTKSLALGLDLAGLEGTGGDIKPLGIIQRTSMPGGASIQTVTSSRPGLDGDQLVAEDIYRMVAAVEEANADFEGWIMRPKTWYKYLQLRADAVSQGDRQGMFLFNLIREPGDAAKPALATYPVTKSTQVSQVRSKGAGSNLTYLLGGMFSDVLLGMFGAIEFAATTQGDGPFVNDQTWVRGILSADLGIRHEAAIVFMDNLQVNLGA